MPTVDYLKPLDQPFGPHRLAAWLSASLRSGRFATFQLISAFVKEGALLRLEGALSEFRQAGGRAEAIFGIDQRGTSYQALRFALEKFDRAFVWHHPNAFVTFHPKIYMFEGPRLAQISVGSSNLTVGGTETNCEAAIQLTFDLPGESAEWRVAQAGWIELLAHPNTVRLDDAFLQDLDTIGLLVDENILGTRPTGAPVGGRGGTAATPQPFPPTPLLAPSPRPVAHSARTRGRARGARGIGTRRPLVSPVRATGQSLPRALIIQVVPHHNGEIFLSKLAVAQFPAFFGFPFSGRTTPKRPGNPPYPQRDPDPVVHLTIYDDRGHVVRSLPGFRLNTVYYSRKSEIRITVPPDVARAITKRSLLQMSRPTSAPSPDYLCDIFPPTSVQYARLIAACNQTMPSGGGGISRKFGWI